MRRKRMRSTQDPREFSQVVRSSSGRGAKQFTIIIGYIIRPAIMLFVTSKMTSGVSWTCAIVRSMIFIGNKALQRPRESVR